MLFRKIDSEGNFIGDVILNTHPVVESQDDGNVIYINDPLYRTELVPAGTYKPKFDFDTGTFIEGLSAQEIDAIQNVEQPLSETDQLRLEMAESSTELFEMIIETRGGETNV